MRRKEVRRRGQAALEYVITYGWGFLVIILTLGALAYFGFLSPSRYIPARCDFGSQLECSDYKVTSEGTNGAVYLQFRNNFGDDIQINAIYLFQENNHAGLTATSLVIGKGNISAVIKAVPNNPNQFTDGARMTIPVVVTFRRAFGAPVPPEHNVTGEVFATVLSS